MLFFIFDVDGTILDSEHLYFKYMADAVEEVFGAEEGQRVRDFMESEAFTAYYGRGDKEILEDLLEGKPVEEVYSAYLNKVEENVANIISRENFVPGFENFLSSTKEPFCLVSSSHKKVLERLLNLLPRKPSFMVTGDDVVNHKPHPEPYLKAKESLPTGFKPVVFEDALAGKQSAEEAGFKNVVCIRTCYWQPCFKDWNALMESDFLSKIS